MAIVLGLGLVSAGCVPGSGPEPPASCGGSGSRAHLGLPYARAAGVDPNLLSLDLYEPVRPAGCGPAPVVVYVHGGGLVEGDKGNRIADKVRLFTSQGWVFASVNYRLSTPGPSGQPVVRYPVHEQDVAAAIAWIDGHVGRYGGDPGRILLLGHSSGAFLVSLVSTDTSFLQQAGVDPGVVRCTASLDTEYDVVDAVDQGGSLERLYRNALGDDPATWQAGSPIGHTAPGAPRPSFLVVTRGAARRVAGSQRFVDALRDGGTTADLLDAGPLTHEEVNAAVGRPGDAVVTPPLLAFFQRCVAG